MKICIPTMDGVGEESTPADHFGSAPYFTFADTEADAYESVPNQGANHVHGSCQPIRYLGDRKVDVVVCRGLGRRALSRLQEAGVEVFVTLEKNARESVKALEEGRLRLLDSEEACQGHGHGHQHGHGNGQGQVFFGGGRGRGGGSGCR
jgi:predicted Fe-Mo cluster-binding NifX family protein